MFRCPEVGLTGVPSMATTGLPSASPRVSNVGPGPSATNGTVTSPSSSPNTRMGTSATASVSIRLFTHHTVTAVRRGNGGTVVLMPDVPFGFSAGDDPDRDPSRDPDKKDPAAGADPFGFGGDFKPGDLGQLFSKLGQMFSGAGSAMAAGKDAGPVNYDLARKLASSSIGFTAPIAEPTAQAVRDAVHLADTWLDGATSLPAGATKAVAWTPQDWVDGTLETWKRLCDPMAAQISSVWSSALDQDGAAEIKAMAGPLMAMMTQMGGMAFGSQLGQALGTLSKEVLTSTDIGLPLGPRGVAVLMPAAIEELSEGLEQSRSEIMTFLAAREAAHRLTRGSKARAGGIATPRTQARQPP